MKKWEAKVFDCIKNENTYNKIKKFVDLILQENKKYDNSNIIDKIIADNFILNTSLFKILLMLQ